MNFKNQVNKINRGFVYLDGTWSRPGFFVPARGGGPHPRRGWAGPGAPFPPGGGKGGGLGGVVPVSGHKKTAHHGHPGRGAGRKAPGGRRPHCGPGIVIIARMY